MTKQYNTQNKTSELITLKIRIANETCLRGGNKSQAIDNRRSTYHYESETEWKTNRPHEEGSD